MKPPKLDKIRKVLPVMEDGADEGLTLGLLDGDAEGVTLGDMEGEVDGTADGCVLGWTLGLSLNSS